MNHERRRIIVWGLSFMVAYLYVFQICTTTTLKPIPGAFPDHIDEIRDMPKLWVRFANGLMTLLDFISFPAKGIVLRFFPNEPFYMELVYIPFFSAIWWFGYGCLIGWLGFRGSRTSRR